MKLVCREQILSILQVWGDAAMTADKNKSLVHIRVAKHTLQGLYVVLDNGEQGIIRTREISWSDEDITRWREIYPIGWEGYAFAIPTKKGEAQELSLRFVKYDPWDDFFEGLEQNHIFEGIVTGVYEYGAFIEIEQGIKGLLHKSQLPPKIQAPITDVFWHGDKVMVTIREVDHDQRQIAFSLAPAQALTDEKTSSGRHLPSGGAEAEQNLESLLEANFPRHHILVVEDEPAQSAAVCNWLRDFGQSVEMRTNAEEALIFLSKSEPDIVLIDVGLPNMSGTELAQIVLTQYPHVQVVNMTDWARASEVYNALEEVQARGGRLLYKPLLPEDLANFLLYNQDHGSLTSRDEQAGARPHSNKIGSQRDIHNLLAMCRKRLGMEYIFLFALEPAHRRVWIADRTSDGTVNRNAIAQLIHSPVRDVAEDGDSFFISEVGERERRRFQYLLEFSPQTAACIGIPIPSKSTLKYALFAMDRRAKSFGDEIKMYMEGMALAISATLDQITLKEQAALIQRSALIGNLTSGMIHEINNLVAPLQYESNHLRKSLVRAEKEADYDREAIKAEIANIERDIRQIISTVKTFGRIAKKPQEELLKVDEIIDDTLILLNHLSKRAKTKIYFEQPERIVIVRNQAVTLEQIVLNVSLNAIQQIEEHRAEGGGSIRIEIELFEETQEEATCRILIRDNGPGIHAALWGKIFEMGYSTRQDGSGIGLFVSRNLMEEIGGRIYVADSHILYGSTFAVEFPVQF